MWDAILKHFGSEMLSKKIDWKACEHQSDLPYSILTSEQSFQSISFRSSYFTTVPFPTWIK